LENPNANLYRSHRFKDMEAIEFDSFIPTMVEKNAII